MKTFGIYSYESVLKSGKYWNPTCETIEDLQAHWTNEWAWSEADLETLLFHQTVVAASEYEIIVKTNY